MRGKIKRLADSVRVFRADKPYAVDFEKTIEKIKEKFDYNIIIENITKEDVDHKHILLFLKYVGVVIDKGNKNYSIKVTPFDLEHRKNSTKAHELGHILLQHIFFKEHPKFGKIMGDKTGDIIGSSRDDADLTEEEKQEDQAKEFAAVLLMPEIKIRERFTKKIIGYSLDELKIIANNDFNVSRAALIVRLASLGYWV